MSNLYQGSLPDLKYIWTRRAGTAIRIYHMLFRTAGAGLLAGAVLAAASQSAVNVWLRSSWDKQPLLLEVL